MCRSLVLYILWVAEWTSGQSYYDPNVDYQPMTDEFDVRHRGTVTLPPCVKDLMYCWELVNPDVVCKEETWWKVVRMDTMCMDLRFQCREYMGNAPFPGTTPVSSILNYCYQAKFIHRYVLKDGLFMYQEGFWKPRQYRYKNNTIIKYDKTEASL